VPFLVEHPSERGACGIAEKVRIHNKGWHGQTCLAVCPDRENRVLCHWPVIAMGFFNGPPCPLYTPLRPGSRNRTWRTSPTRIPGIAPLPVCGHFQSKRSPTTCRALLAARNAPPLAQPQISHRPKQNVPRETHQNTNLPLRKTHKPGIFQERYARQHLHPIRITSRPPACPMLFRAGPSEPAASKEGQAADHSPFPMHLDHPQTSLLEAGALFGQPLTPQVPNRQKGGSRPPKQPPKPPDTATCQAREGWPLAIIRERT